MNKSFTFIHPLLDVKPTTTINTIIFQIISAITNTNTESSKFYKFTIIINSTFTITHSLPVHPSSIRRLRQRMLKSGHSSSEYPPYGIPGHSSTEYPSDGQIIHEKFVKIHQHLNKLSVLSSKENS